MALCSLEDDGEILLELNEIDCYESDTEVAGDSVSEQSEIVQDQLTMTYNSEDTPPFLIYKSVRMDKSSHIKEPSNEHNLSLLAGSNASPTPDHEPIAKIKIDSNSSKTIRKHPQHQQKQSLITLQRPWFGVLSQNWARLFALSLEKQQM